MLQVAVERVHAEGLLLGYENIELEDLIRVAGVPRSTVFRIWPDRAAFVADLVRALFEADPNFGTGFDEPTLSLLDGVIAANADAMRTVEGRQIALREAIRAAVAHNMVAVETTAAWRVYRTMSAALAAGDAVPGGENIRVQLEEIVDRYVVRMAEVYRELNAVFGLRMRDGLSERDLAVAIVAVIDGMGDHRRISPALIGNSRDVAVGPEGAREWHLAAIAVYGVYTAFTENVPV
jgi:AcrR family transcriptional regulator